MGKKVWIEYTEKDADTCMECRKAEFLIEDWNKSHEVHIFCSIGCQEMEDGKCPKFKKL